MTSEYNRWPDKAGSSRRHFGRAVDRSIGGYLNKIIVQRYIIAHIKNFVTEKHFTDFVGR